MISALGLFNYWIFITLMAMGLYVVMSRGNLIKKIIGLNIFQSSVFLFFISLGKVDGGTAPIVSHSKGAEALEGVLYANPLPHVLILTAIVVGVSTTAVALSLAVRIYEAYGTIEDEELNRAKSSPT